ncbi:hypothetical protein [Microbacterium sp. B19]|uniref:hypothetical protein n=1 Tax=Microbacterium sp. B19 TaxID=96765 RepID=UPI000345AECC|nr:hypothetical protein [Microbacterium sp. B19]
MTAVAIDRFELLHQIKVRGFASAHAVATGLGHVDEAGVEAALRELEALGLLKYREGRVTGFSLTPDGRSTHAELRDTALSAAQRATVTHAYEGFLGPNREFKTLTTDWQTRDQSEDPAPLLGRLDDLHARVDALLVEAAHAQPRFAQYRQRFADARGRLLAGDASAFARPMSESYHDVWMELHEDFVSSLGHERTEADE